MDQELQHLSSNVARLLQIKNKESCSSDISNSNQDNNCSVSISDSDDFCSAEAEKRAKDHQAVMPSAGDWQQQMAEALEKALGHRLDSLAVAIVKPLQAELQQLVTVIIEQLHPDTGTVSRGRTNRTNTNQPSVHASPALRMQSPQPLEGAELAGQANEERNCDNGGVQELAAGNPSSRGRRRRMALAAGHSVILTESKHRTQRHAATPAPNASFPVLPVAEEKAEVDHLAAAVAVMAEATSMAPSSMYGSSRRTSSLPSTEEHKGAIYCGGGGGVASGTKHLLSSGFFSSTVINKEKVNESLLDSYPGTRVQTPESGHPLSILSPAAAEAAFAFGVALAREEKLHLQGSSARTLWQSNDQAVSDESSLWQSSSNHMMGQSAFGQRVVGGDSDKGSWGTVGTRIEPSPTGEIGWMQSVAAKRL